MSASHWILFWSFLTSGLTSRLSLGPSPLLLPGYAQGSSGLHCLPLARLNLVLLQILLRHLLNFHLLVLHNDSIL